MVWATLKMKILLLSPKSGIPKSKKEVNSFTSVWCYYLYHELRTFDIEIDFLAVPPFDSDEELSQWFENLDVEKYHGIVALGLRYFSQLPQAIGQSLYDRYQGILCQLYDGSRLDSDPVDVTFTFRDDDWRYPLGSSNNRYQRHHDNNVLIGWAADSRLIKSKQPRKKLSILVDHSAFNHNASDRSFDTLMNIRNLIHSGVYKDHGFDSVEVRRFVSGEVEIVDIDNFTIERYDRKGISYVDACKEYSKSHIFCVTHEESVGQAIIENATSGALILSPKGLVNKDRLNTTRHIEWDSTINWQSTLDAIDIKKSRQKALENSWHDISKKIIDTIETRYNQKHSEESL